MKRKTELAAFVVLTCVAIFAFVHANDTLNSTSNKVNLDPNLLIERAGQFASRLMWMNKRRRFVLPTGTILTLSPKITLPVFRNKPFDGGLNSDIQATWLFYVYFDKMGMTSDEHPWPFKMPPFYPFGNFMRGPIRQKKETDKAQEKEVEEESLEHARNRGTRQKRSVLSLPPPEKIHGGERAVILPKIEGILSSIGMDGRPCLLRAICEIHEYPLEKGYGFFGELVTLFFSISRSQYAESHMPEYLKAEEAGKAGECSSYFKNCRKSIFMWEEKNKYSEEMQNVIPSERHYHTEEADLFGNTHRDGSS